MLVDESGKGDAEAFDISADGSVVVGYIWQNGEGDIPFRWSITEGLVWLERLSPRDHSEGARATAVSGDGRVVFGRAYDEANDRYLPVRWTSEGMDAPANMAGIVRDVSFDGRIIVGSVPGVMAFRWTQETGMTPLGAGLGTPHAMTSDGTIVVGEHSAGTQIWMPGGNTRDLKEMLENDCGLDLTDWALNEAVAVSDDGRTIVGLGRNPEGYSESWIVELPPWPQLIGLVISGAEESVGGALIAFEAKVTRRDGTTSDVTAEATWSVLPQEYGTFEERGVLTLVERAPAGTVTVYATYSEGGETVTAEKSLAYTPKPPTPVALQISGPAEVAGGESVGFEATAVYDDGSTANVTSQTTWTVSPPKYGTFNESGVLTPVTKATAATLTIVAQYVEGETTVSDELSVSYLPVTVALHVSAQSGDDGNSGMSLQEALATIQEAVARAVDGDTILVHPGVYEGEVTFEGKAITIRSAGEPAVLENPNGFAVFIRAGEGPDSVLKNFVITNSRSAVFIANSSPTLTNLTVANNDYGVEAYGTSQPEISNCIFWNNITADLIGAEAAYSWVQEQRTPEFPEGLISYWPFEEARGATTFDAVSGREGTIHDAEWTNGWAGAALQFDGVSSYVRAADLPELASKTHYTVAAWINTNTLANNFAIVTAYRPAHGSVVFMLDRHLGDVRLTIRDTQSRIVTLVHPNALTIGNWYHVVGVRAGDSCQIFVNSRPGPTASAPFGTIEPGVLTIGAVDCCGHGVHHNFSGLIDEVAVFDRALSGEQVAQLYHAGISRHGYAAGPLFVDPANGDYHLLSRRGRYWPEHKVWVLDKVDSPGIDAGAPDADFSQEPDPNGGRINQGAYGGTPFASMSEWPLEWDYNYDGEVDLNDLVILLEQWLHAVDWAAK